VEAVLDLVIIAILNSTHQPGCLSLLSSSATSGPLPSNQERPGVVAEDSNSCVCCVSRVLAALSQRRMPALVEESNPV